METKIVSIFNPIHDVSCIPRERHLEIKREGRTMNIIDCIILQSKSYALELNKLSYELQGC